MFWQFRRVRQDFEHRYTRFDLQYEGIIPIVLGP